MRKLALSLLLAASPLMAQQTMSLQDAISTGLEANYGIQLARRSAAIARNDASAGNAGMLPTVDLGITPTQSYSTTRQEFFSGDVREVNFARTTSLNGSIALSWTIFDGFAMYAAKDRLEALAGSAEEQLKASVDATVAAITSTYYSLVRQTLAIDVTRRAIGLSLERLNLARAKYGLGAEAEPAVLQARVDLNADSARLVQQQAELQRGRADLNRLLTRPPATDFRVDTAFSVAARLEWKAIERSIDSTNPALAAQRLQHLAARASIEEAQARMLPRVTLNGGLNGAYSTSEVGLLVSNQSYGPQIGLAATFNLFNGGNDERMIANAKVMAEMTAIQEKDLTLSLQTEAWKVYTTWEASLRQLELEERNVEAARRNAEIAFERFRYGVIGDIEVRETQQKLVDAEGRLLEAKALAKIAETELRRLSGTILE